MRASALIPRMYRHTFNRDLLVDMHHVDDAMSKAVTKGMTKAEADAARVAAIDLEVFENLAWCMMRHAGEDVPADPDEWLATLDPLEIFSILPDVMNLWAANNLTTAKPAKK